jgi:hypothetical protein
MRVYWPAAIGCFEGGETGRVAIFRWILFSIILILFLILVYLPLSDSAVLITAIALSCFVWLIEFLIWLISWLIDHSQDFSESLDTIEDARPDDIPPELWQARAIFINRRVSLDEAVQDLVADGCDPAAVNRLIEWVDAHPNHLQRTNSDSPGHKPMIFVCGLVCGFPWNRRSLRHFAFSTGHSLSYVIASGFISFGCVWLPLRALSSFGAGEKWLLAWVLATSWLSILVRPEREPFSITVGDPWTGLGRGLAISVLMGIHYIGQYFGNFDDLLLFDFLITIRWRIIALYFQDFAHWGVLLFPVWVLLGCVGHPVCLAASLIESFNRYAFGQSGAIGHLFLVIQFVRGAVSTGILWWILESSKSRKSLGIAVTVATFLGMLPVWWNESNRREWRTYLVWPIACTIGAFAMSFALIGQLETEFWNTVRIFSFVWFLAVDLLFPYAYSFQRYFVVGTRLFEGCGCFNLIRSLSQLLVAPLFITASLSEATIPPIVLALVIVHAVQKAQTEPHVFAFAVVLAAITFPDEYGSTAADANLLLALLLVSKCEVAVPLIEYLQASRADLFYLAEACESWGDSEAYFVFYFPLSILLRIPFPDFAIRIPILAWSLVTGAPAACAGDFITVPFPSFARPFWFFGSPARAGVDFRALFGGRRAARPVETAAVGQSRV